MTDLIIGGASGYNWNQLKIWVRSIRESGFQGDVCLVATDVDADTVATLRQNGVEVALYKAERRGLTGLWRRARAPHVERFHEVAKHLERVASRNYKNVIMTDVSDVLFQMNPSTWLEENLGANKLVFSSEGLSYQDEPFNRKNINDTFGQDVFNDMKDRVIFCVGVLAGDARVLTGLLSLIHQMSLNRPIKIVDQAVFNYMIRLDCLAPALLVDNSSGWAIHLGNTEKAISAGAGSLGQYVNGDQGKFATYLSQYSDIQPKIEGRRVIAPDGRPFAIVHQYNRIPDLDAEVRSHYA